MNVNGKNILALVLGLSLVASMTAATAFARGGGGRGSSGGHVASHSMGMTHMNRSMPHANFQPHRVNRTFNRSNLLTTNRNFSNRFSNVRRNSSRGITTFKSNKLGTNPRRTNRMAIARLGMNHRTSHLKNGVTAKHFTRTGPFWKRYSAWDGSIEADGDAADCEECESPDGEVFYNPYTEDDSPVVAVQSATPINQAEIVAPNAQQDSDTVNAVETENAAAPISDAADVGNAQAANEAQTGKLVQKQGGKEEDGDDDNDDVQDERNVKPSQNVNESDDEDDSKAPIDTQAELSTDDAAESVTPVKPMNPVQRLATLRQLAAVKQPKPVTPVAPVKPVGSAATPVSSLAGTWKASPEDGVTIELTLNADASFIWKLTAKGKSKSFKGQYKLADKNLVLTRTGDTQVMEGAFERKTGNAFTFRMKNSDDDDEGLSFTR